MTTLCDCGGVLGRAIGHLSFGLSQFHGHGSRLACEVVLIKKSLSHMYPTLWGRGG